MSQDQKQLDEKLEIYIPNGPRLGTNVIEAIGVSKGYDDKLLYDNLNFNLPQAGIVGVIGPNGAGKTTIFRMIMGEEHQIRASLKLETPQSWLMWIRNILILILKNLFGKILVTNKNLVMMGGRQVNSRAYLSRFNF